MKKQELEIKLAQLKRKCTGYGCPCCGWHDFDILDGTGVLNASVTPNHGSPRHLQIPYAVVVCKNCGFIREHAIAALNTNPTDGTTGGKNA